MRSPIDPIEQLVEALERRGHPPLAWIVRWSAAGTEPVATAWAKSRSPSHLVRVLEIARHPALREARRLLSAPILFESTDGDRARSDAIRRAVSTPPTLEQLLAACASRLAFVTRDAMNFGAHGAWRYVSIHS